MYFKGNKKQSQEHKINLKENKKKYIKRKRKKRAKMIRSFKKINLRFWHKHEAK